MAVDGALNSSNLEGMPGPSRRKTGNLASLWRTKERTMPRYTYDDDPRDFNATMRLPTHFVERIDEYADSLEISRTQAVIDLCCAAMDESHVLEMRILKAIGHECE